MKIRAERKALADTIAWINQAVPKNPPAPVLAGIRLTATDGVLTLRSYDYDVSHQARLAVDVVTDGECLIPGAFLSHIIGSLKGNEVELVLDGGRLTITAGRSTYSTQAMVLEDYPSLPAQPTTVGTVDAGDLISALLAARGMVDMTSETADLISIHLEGDEACLTVVGTSRFGMAVAEVDWTPSGELDVTVPVKAVDSAARGLLGEVAIGMDGGVFGLSDARHSVTLRTLENAKYPKWRRLLRQPDADVLETVVENADLAEAVKRAGAFADFDNPLVVTVEADLIGVEIATQQHAGGTEVVEAESTGTTVFAIHPPYLLGALAAMPPGPIRIGLPDQSGVRLESITIRPTAPRGRISLVMPKRLPEGTR